jgi:WD40 repeat protein
MLYANKPARVLEGHTDSVTCVRLFGHALRAVSISKDSSIRIWSTKDGMCLKSFSFPTVNLS